MPKRHIFSSSRAVPVRMNRYGSFHFKLDGDRRKIPRTP
uniref:Uncharacterized protein n=1 Tax=Siphoviridae sp. ctSqC25 TaxID=2823582 RepID=A0A8S5L643_9CAUD|nr:MAG TPA: hypothetical protein [Siphoviridae sp. ctSqC25]